MKSKGSTKVSIIESYTPLTLVVEFSRGVWILPNSSSTYFRVICTVMVWAQVGKEFPVMRPKEREIKFIRMGDTVRTVSQLKGEPVLNRGPRPTFIARIQGVG